MRIVIIRRVAQVFFLALFLWFAVVMTFGEKFHQLRGWPVNWFMQLDPLVGISTMLGTRTLYAGLLWGLLTVVLTVLIGRFFCGWVCPFGTLHQFFGWIGLRGKKPKERLAANRYRKAQNIKYYILILFLVMAAMGSVQAGLLDPIPLMHRSVNLVLLPIADRLGVTSATPRQYTGVWVVGAIFVGALLLNFVFPRFYCRVLCPAGALFGLLSRNTVWRIARVEQGCTGCTVCETACEGACEPSGKVRMSECVVCCNCMDSKCKHDRMTYKVRDDDAAHAGAPDIGRRGVLVALAASAFAVPAVRLSGAIAANWHPRTIRPPGSMPEEEFLERCIKCGQCMRVCPSNCIMPAGIEGGFENLWTPVMNYRIGSSGCQLNCVACGHVCPTAAIRPLTLEEKHGTGKWAEHGPISQGLAYVDRGRCLPWSMDTPCIVCEENCPVTPKAIYVKEFFETVRNGSVTVAAVDGAQIDVAGLKMTPGQFATGDYYATMGSGDESKRLRIVANADKRLTLGQEDTGEFAVNPGDKLRIEVKLQAPVVDLTKCIGCGICEHECPVSGLRAIRVTAENETRNTKNSLQLRRT
jgi:polyferredoxin